MISPEYTPLTRGGRKVKKLFIQIALGVVKILFRLRYKMTYVGLDKVKQAMKTNSQGTLFLPNHPAILVDPLMIAFPVLAPYGVRALVTEYMFFNPLFNWIMRLIRALPVPNFSTGIDEGLKEGQAFLIYPAGMTKKISREILGGTFAVHDLLVKNPDTRVILMRLSGLWGSRFSRAYTNGRQVDLLEMMKRSFVDMLKACIFFLPRRNVTIEFEIAPLDLPRTETKFVLNRYLEKWYNKPYAHTESKGEPLTIVPYSPWGGQLPRVMEEKQEDLSEKGIPKEVEHEVIAKLAELAHVPIEEVTLRKHITADLCLDSLNIAELITFLETRYEVQSIDPQSLGTVTHVLLAATNQLEAAKIPEFDWDTKSWEKTPKKEKIHFNDKKTIPQVFLETADKRLFHIIATDPLNGPVTYHTLKSRLLLLVHELGKLPGKRIGILLPASIGANLLILACQLAGKVPVMINWTVGGRHLESVVGLSEIKAVLTSWTFLDRLENVDLTPIQDLLVVLEELRATFSWWHILSSPVKAYLPTTILSWFGCLGEISRLRPESEAVILFTSGTESMPKGVPLTHNNIVTNMRASLQCIELFTTDIFLSSLPPFHSFGFSLTGLLPLLAGVKTVFSPNPADAGMQVRALTKWKPTIMCSAPSFLINILRQGKADPFPFVRLVVSGAEKPPEELFTLVPVVAPNAQYLEGYGITECAPVLTINASGAREMGVGKPIPGVSLQIVHQDDFSLKAAQGEAGMILASGPNVFQGYLQKDVKSPFFEEAGIRWYVTGDLGICTPQGTLVITGRLKRFIKIGGEMISLGAIEAALMEEAHMGSGEGPQLAVCAKESKEGRPRIVLFSTKDLVPMEVNSLLRQKGFANLVRIDRVVTVDEIPLSGTGKIAYRQLETLLA
jgi:long-chain-fatty-acid--[acyl-carrier-protein] ligase